jgi:hypothetical protein
MKYMQWAIELDTKNNWKFRVFESLIVFQKKLTFRIYSLVRVKNRGRYIGIISKVDKEVLERDNFICEIDLLALAAEKGI